MISGKPRCESTAVSPCPGKCFAVAIAPAACAPFVNAAAKRATSAGSSPYERVDHRVGGVVVYIDDGQDLMHAERARFASSPLARAYSGLPVAPTAMFQGKLTVSSKRIPAPASRSAEMSKG